MTGRDASAFPVRLKRSTLQYMSLPRRTLLAIAGLAPLAAKAGDTTRLVVPLATDPARLIPGLDDSSAARMVGSKIYQGLWRFSEDVQPQAELATHCQISTDGRTYSFTLRSGVAWHDGEPFTAEDVIFSLYRFHRALSTRTAPMLARITNVRAPDAQTLVLTLGEPFEPFPLLLDVLSAPIVPKHIHDRPGFALDPRQTTPVGTGPFRFASWLRLVRSEGAPLHPALDAIEFPVLDPAARLALLKSGQPVLMAGDAVDLGAAPLYRRAASMEGEILPNLASLAWLEVNHRVKPLDDPRVRLALAYAIDRAAVLREAWAGFGRPASGPVVTSARYADPQAKLPSYNPRAASGQLDAAGLRPDDTGVRARIRHLVRPSEPWPRLAAMLRTALSEIGIELVLETVSPAEWPRRIAAFDYETTGMVADQRGDPALDVAPLYTTGANASGYSNPTVDALFTTGGTPDDRRRALAQAQAILIADMAQIWLVEPLLPVVRDRRVTIRGSVYSGFGEAVVAG
jgi:peptide/nickel transport system substrate-binding protein